MRMWKERTLVYKVGYIGANLATLLFIVGFCTPSWALFKLQTGESEGHHPTQSLGLWQVCTEDLSLCTLALHSDNPGWLKAVRALQCIAMFFAVASCFIGLYTNCILKAQVSSNIFNKNMETSAIVAVSFSTFGVIMFASQIENYYTRYSSGGGHVWWGYVLVCLATALLMLSACLMLLSHKLHALSELRGRAGLGGGAGGQFGHRQFSNSSFHSNVRLPDYSESTQQVFITSGDTSPPYTEVSPPAYETVISCDGVDAGAAPVVAFDNSVGATTEGTPPPPYSPCLVDPGTDESPPVLSNVL